MKKAIIIITVILSFIIILDSVSAGHWVILFLLAGIIPGTDMVISPIDMMSATATAVTIIILRISLWPRIRYEFEKRIHASDGTQERLPLIFR